MKISVIGSGYVGLVAGVCFAELGFYVNCIDKDDAKIEKLKQGISPIYEPGLDVLLKKNISSKRLHFTTEINVINEYDVIVIAVGTPPKESGEVDLQYVYATLDDIVAHVNQNKIIIMKSTVPVGTASIVREKLKTKAPNLNFEIISNPEFLREGMAIHDFMKPDRIVIGLDSEKARAAASKLYASFINRNVPIVFTDNKSAELIKYASNAYLACRVSFINQMADLSEALGANIKDIEYGIGLDNRIGGKYLKPGPGFGGSCFPKDVMGLLNIAKKNQIECPVIKAAFDYNTKRMKDLAQKISNLLLKETSKKITVGVLGVTFKADTDDVRYSPSIHIILNLLQLLRDIQIKLYDPMGMKNAKINLPKSIHYCTNAYEVAKDAEILVIMTEWDEFLKLDFSKIKQAMKAPMIYDFRNILSEKTLTSLGFQYHKIGKKHE